ncbi:MAG: calcium-binding protein, partial [Planctomycetota bacterium]
MVNADFDGDGSLDLATANTGSDNVSILLGAGNGVFQNAVNLATGSALGEATDSLVEIEDIIGSPFGDDLRGDGGPNRILGEAPFTTFGNDTIRGDGGNDTLQGGGGDDQLNGESGVDQFMFEGTAAPDFVDADWDGIATQLVLNRRSSAGGAIVETDRGSALETLLVSDMLFAPANDDRFDLSSLSAADITAAGLLAATLDGIAGNDTLIGGAGNESFVGGSGNDQLDGRGGNDTLAGGTGNDVYLFQNAWGTDTLTELVAEGSDVMSFAAVSVNLNVALGSITVLDGSGNSATYSGNDMESLIGGSGNDTFSLSDGAQLAGGAGTIDGSGGTNTLNYVAYTTAVTVNLTT